MVRKLKPEDLLPKWIAVLADIGNRKANKFWEFNMKSSERPKEESDDKEWFAFLQKKYIEKAWIDSKDKKVQEHEDEVYVLFFFSNSFRKNNFPTDAFNESEMRETNASVDLVDLFNDAVPPPPTEEKLSDVYAALAVL